MEFTFFKLFHNKDEKNIFIDNTNNSLQGRLKDIKSKIRTSTRGT